MVRFLFEEKLPCGRDQTFQGLVQLLPKDIRFMAWAHMSQVVGCGRVILLTKGKLKTLKTSFNVWDRLKYPFRRRSRPDSVLWIETSAQACQSMRICYTLGPCSIVPFHLPPYYLDKEPSEFELHKDLVFVCTLDSLNIWRKMISSILKALWKSTFY